MSALDFKAIVLAMAEARPDTQVSLIVDLALAVENAQPPNLDDAQSFGQWALRQPIVAQYLEGEFDTSKKIHAIKELRALTRCSLLQAKLAIEAVTA